MVMPSVFAENLLTERLKRNLSGNKLAALAGISQSLLSKLENGARRPTDDTITKLANALELPERQLRAWANADYMRSQGHEIYANWLSKESQAVPKRLDVLKVLNYQLATPKSRRKHYKLLQEYANNPEKMKLLSLWESLFPKDLLEQLPHMDRDLVDSLHDFINIKSEGLLRYEESKDSEETQDEGNQI